VNQANDGERNLLRAAESEQPSRDSIDNPKLTLLAEELSVEKEAVETGRLRVSKQTHTREVAVDDSLERARKLRRFQLDDGFSRCHLSATRATLLSFLLWKKLFILSVV